MTPPANAPPRVLLVGHCVPDAYMLKNIVERYVPSAVVLSITQQADLERELAASPPHSTPHSPPHVLLVNRVIDGYFEHSIGQVLIRSLAARPNFTPSLILISNLDEAQRDAESAGAMPGFGKSNLYDDQTRQRLLAAIDAAHARGV